MNFRSFSWRDRPYRPTFLRHLSALAISDFYAHGLDADDHAFVERIRERGVVACGSLAQPTFTTMTFDQAPQHHHGFEEELKFWEQPWDVEEGIPRRIGRLVGEKEEARLEREKRDRLRRALREKEHATRAAEKEQDRLARAHEEMLMAQELEREQKIWNEKQAVIAREREKRLQQMTIADKEWEAAKPWHTKHQTPRHYVPEWKRNLQRQKIKAALKPERDARAAYLRSLRRKKTERRRAAEAEKNRLEALRLIEEKQRLEFVRLKREAWEALRLSEEKRRFEIRQEMREAWLENQAQQASHTLQEEARLKENFIKQNPDSEVARAVQMNNRTKELWDEALAKCGRIGMTAEDTLEWQRQFAAALKLRWQREGFPENDPG